MMADPGRDPQINISKIPVRGGFGALAIILVLLGIMVTALPELRWLAVYGVGTGLLVGVVLILWRRRRS
jgi:hypothetical protein